MKKHTVKIASDTPEKLIKLFKRIDLSKVPTEKHNAIIDQLKEVASQYIPKRKDKPKGITIELDGCPQRLATLVSQFDFNALNGAKKIAGFVFIENWLKKNNLLKR